MILKNLLFRLEIQHQQQIKERLELICLLVISKKIMQRNMSLQKKKDKKKANYDNNMAKLKSADC